MIKNFGRPDLNENDKKLPWRLELETPSVPEHRRTMYEFDDDEYPVIEKMVATFNRAQSDGWSMGIFPNE
jgi:hypothetical protein